MTPEFAQAVDRVFLSVLGTLEQIGRGEEPEPKEERLRIRGWLDQAEALVAHMEREFGNDPAEHARNLARRSVIEDSRGNIARGVELAEQALPLLPAPAQEVESERTDAGFATVAGTTSKTYNNDDTRLSLGMTGTFAFSGHDRTHAHMIQADPSGRFVLHGSRRLASRRSPPITSGAC